MINPSDDDAEWTPVQERDPDPEHDAELVRDMYCFFSEKVDIELDGVVVERPSTQWSPREDASGATALRGLMGRPDA